MKIEEMDIDFIGGEGTLTALEEKALHDYFKQQKLNKTIESQSEKLVLGKKQTTTKKKLLSKAT
jgi:hypothetical protein